jgi:hypothetical protein
MRLTRLSLNAAGTAVGEQAPSVVVARQPTLTLVPPPRPDAFARFDDGPGATRHRHRTLLAMAGLHVLVVAGLLAATRGHEAVTEAVPVILSLVSAPEPVQAPKPLPLPPPTQHTLVVPRLDIPIIAPEQPPAGLHIRLERLDYRHIPREIP